MVYNPKEIPEGVNVTKVHPLVNFAYLLATVIVVSGLVYLGLGAIATQLALRISPEMETKIGQSIIAEVPNLDRESTPRQREYLEDLLASLQNSNLDNYPPLKLHIQQDKIANAFIFPGGHIVVTNTLLQEAESENELAFVLAHELGHHIARDHLKGLGRSLVLLTIASVLGIGGGNADVVGFTGSLSNLHYSRQQESAADVFALSAIIDIYGHGGASLDFFHRIQTKKKDRRGKVSAYFSTHPLTSARIDDLDRIAAEQGWSMKGELTALPDDIF